jgi:pimeloyl-ACP methyl ester carboxylesterase
MPGFGPPVADNTAQPDTNDDTAALAAVTDMPATTEASTPLPAYAESPGGLFTTEAVPCPDSIVNSRGFTTNAAHTEVEGETYSCGVVVVPENYNEPDVRTLELFYLKLHSFSQSPAPDPVVYLSGGPGSSGSHEVVQFPVLLANMNALRERRDIIAYDQRGTGLSNFLLCAPFESAIGIFQERAGTAEISATLEELQAGEGLGYQALRYNLCGVVVKELASVDLGQYNSVVSAQDILHVVEAQGYTEGYNLYGTSYGTKLAQFAMRDTSGHIRSVVLDGTVSPTIRSNMVGFANDFETYVALFAQCEADTACRAAYPNVAERFGALLAELEAQPLVFDPPLVLQPEYAQFFGGPTLSQITPGFFRAIDTINNASETGGLGGSVPRMILAAEEGDTAYFASLLGGSAPPPEGQPVPLPAPEDELARVQADQPLFQLPFDALLVTARNEAAEADPGIDTQWLAIVLEDFRARLVTGENEADLMEDLLYLSVLPNTGTDAQVLVDFADEHLSPAAAEAATAVVGQMTRSDVRATLWHIQDVAMILGAYPDSRTLSMGMWLAVNCADEIAFSSVEDAQTYLDASPYPQLAEMRASDTEVFINGCLSFPTTLDESVTDAVVSDIPTLLFLGQLDTQTPVTWGRLVAEGLSSDLVVEWNNKGHFLAIRDRYTCAGDIAAAFFDDPTREPNLSCSQSDRYRLQFVLPE